jgi:hypothetical protein
MMTLALEPFVGEWYLVAVFKHLAPADAGARVNFDWLPEERSFSPLDFSQRYTGTFSDDRDTITGRWEICHDGETWEHDFDLNYTRA